MDWITITRKRHRRSGCRWKEIRVEPVLIMIVLLCHSICPAEGFFFPRSLFRRLAHSPTSTPASLSAREQGDQVRGEQQQLSFRIVNRPYSNSNLRNNEGGNNNNQDFHVPPSLCLACEKFPWTPVSGADIPSGEQLQQQQSQSASQVQQSNQEIPQLHQIPDQPTATVVINALGESNRRPFAISFNSNQYPNQNNVGVPNVPQFYPSSAQSQLYEAPRKPTILQPVPSFQGSHAQSFTNSNNASAQSASQNINSQQQQTHPPQFFPPPPQQFGIPVFDQQQQYAHHSPSSGYAPPNLPPPPHFQYTRPLPPPKPVRPTILQPMSFNKPPSLRPGDGNRFYPPQPPPQNQGANNNQQNSNVRPGISPITVGTIIAAQHNIQPAKLVYQEHSQFHPPSFVSGANKVPVQNNPFGHGPPPPAPQNIKLPIISRPFATLQIDQLQYDTNVNMNKVPTSRPPTDYDPVGLNPPSPPSKQPVDSFRPQQPPAPQIQQRPPQPSFRPVNNPAPQRPPPPQNYGQPSENIRGQVFFPPPGESSLQYALPLPIGAPTEQGNSNNHQIFHQNINVENNRLALRPVEQLPVVNQDLRHPHQITIPWLLQLEQENQKEAPPQEIGGEYGQSGLNQAQNIQASSQQPEKQNLLPIGVPNTVHVDSIQEYQLSSSSVQNQHKQIPPGSSAPSRNEFTVPQQNTQFIGVGAPHPHPHEKDGEQNSQVESGSSSGEQRDKEPVVETERAPSVPASGWEIIPAVQTDITHLFTKQKQPPSENGQIMTSDANSRPKVEKQRESQQKERPSLPVPLPVPIPVPDSHTSNNPVFIVSEHSQNSKGFSYLGIQEESESSRHEEQSVTKVESTGVPLPNAYDVTNVPVPVSLAENGNGPTFISYPGHRYHTRVNIGIPYVEQRLPFAPKPLPLPPMSSQHKLYEPLPASIVTALNHAQRTSFLTHQHLSQAPHSSATDEKKGTTVYINSVPVRDARPPNFPFIFHQQLRPSDNLNFPQTASEDDISESHPDEHNFSTLSLVSSPSNLDSTNENDVALPDHHEDQSSPSNDEDSNNDLTNPVPVSCNSHTQWVLPANEEEDAPSQPPSPLPTVETEQETPSTQSVIKSKKLVPYIIYSRNPAQQSSRYWFDVSNFDSPPNQVRDPATGTTQRLQPTPSNAPDESESAESPERIVFSPPVYGWSPKVAQKNFESKPEQTEDSSTQSVHSQKSSTAVPFEIISVGHSKEESHDENNQNLLDPEELISGEMELSKLSTTESPQNVPSSTTPTPTRASHSDFASTSTEDLRQNSHIRTPVINPSASPSYTSHIFRFPSTSGYGPGTLLEASNIPATQTRDGPTQTWRAFYRIKSPKYVDDSANGLGSTADLAQSSSEIVGPTTTAECNTETTANFDPGVTDFPEAGPTSAPLPTTTFTPSRIKSVSAEKIRIRGGTAGSGSRFPAGRPSISALNPLPTPISRNPNLSFSALVPTGDYRLSSSQQDRRVEASSIPSAGSSSSYSASSRETFKPENILTLEDIYKSSETKQQFQQENNDDSLFVSPHPTASAPAVVIVTSTEKSSSFSVSVLNETQSAGEREKNPRRISSVRINSNSPGSRVASSGLDEVAQSSDQLLVGVTSTADPTSVGRFSTSSLAPPNTSTKIVKTVRVRQRMRPGSGANNGGPNGPIKSRFNGPGRIRIVQRPVTQEYIKNFPEFASPEGDVLGKEEEEEVKNAIIELKRSEVTRA